MILTHSKIGLRSDKLRRGAQDSLYPSDTERALETLLVTPSKS